MGGQASRPFMTRRNGRIGFRLRTFCSASLKSDSIWSSCKTAAACTADLTIRSAPERCNADTLYRIHGTNEPDSIGQNASSGCIRMRNEAVVDLYNRTPIGTKVIVLATRSVGA